MRPLASTILTILVAASAAACGDAVASSVANEADDLFGETLVPRFELELGPEAKAALREQPKEWVRGTLRYAGTTIEDVGVRLKGNRSRQGFDGKPAFKLKFDEFVDGRRFLGLKELVLNNLVEDPTMVREALAYRLHRDLGVAAPRTGWVQLRVDGEDLGLYLNVEPVGKKLLARSYGEGDGSLYEGEYGCDLHADDAPRFDQDGGDDVGHADLIELAEVAEASPAQLVAADGPLDLDRVVAYLAVSAVIGDFDGYRHAHNYRLYRDPSSARWSLLPWGLDRTFKKHLDITDSGGVIARRCFADAACRARYAAALDRASRRLEALIAEHVLDRWIALVDFAARGDRRRPHDAGEIAEARAALRDFVAARPAEVRAQAACLTASEGCAPAAPPRCEVTVVGGTRFHLCETPLTWSDAAAHCATLGADLARFDGDVQLDAVAKAADDARSRERWWIGLSDRQEEGTAAWSDGAPVTFTRWSKGQPDDDACGEDCAALKPESGRWSDAHCELRRPFVCRD